MRAGPSHDIDDDRRYVSTVSVCVTGDEWTTVYLSVHLTDIIALAYPIGRSRTMAAESSAVKRFDAEFKKVSGTLSITANSIAWVPKSNGAMDRQSQALNRAMGKALAYHQDLIKC